MPRLLLLTLCFTTACLDDCLETKVVRYDGGVCATDEDCASLGQYCDIPTSLCEACTTNAQCSLEATLPTCDVATKACRACATHEDCVGAVGGALCDVDSGQCVQCFTDASCGSGTCDVTTNRCTTVAPRSVDICEPCQSSSQCYEEYACVADVINGQTLGYACMPIPGNSLCSIDDLNYRPLSSLRIATPIGGGTPVETCAPSEVTTCAAIREFLASCTVNSECGAPNIDDGLCTTVMGSPNRCSIPCDVPAQCPGTAPNCTGGVKACR